MSCDTAQPACSQCIRSRVPCEGYHVRLAWVDSTTGTYIEGQRRAYLCDLTWKGHRLWTLKEVDHLIKEPGHRCQCHLHSAPSPFSSFPQIDDQMETLGVPNSVRESEPGGQGQYDFSSLDFNIVDTDDLGSLVSTGQGSAPSCYPDLAQEDHFDMHDPGETDPGHSPTLTAVAEPGEGHHLDLEECRTIPRSRSRLRLDRSRVNIIDILSTSLSLVPCVGVEEQRLFHHYISNLSDLMVPINGGRNPWKSTYPSLAMHDTSRNSTRALYHAILAQSASHQANVKGADSGKSESTLARLYFGKAIRHLRASLTDPTENYSGVLGALLTVSYVENIIQSESRSYRDHFRGAVGFVTQYLSQRPWDLSRDARNVTHNFVLFIVIAQTANNCPSSSTDSITELLYELMSQARFGHTIGANGRLIKAIYQTRLLEEYIAAAGDTPCSQGSSGEMGTRVEEISRKLQVQLVDDEVDMYMEDQESADVGELSRTRTLVKLHLHLFNAAASIYLFCVVLKRPPSDSAEYILQVLTDAITFVDMGGKGVSIWPIFLAAAEAYTLETQVLASNLLNYGEMLGSGNRQDMHRVVRQVWADRQQLAEDRQCDPGEVVVDWREVMKMMALDILLL